ncbi:hypothetical protein QPK13_03050 [Photorhabdus tasmaniensis]
MTRRNIHVSRRKAGENLLKDISEFLSDTLKLDMNDKKSTVTRP